MSENRSKGVVDQHLALSLFLESLLTEPRAEEKTTDAQAVVEPVVGAPVPSGLPVSELAEPVTPSPADVTAPESEPEPEPVHEQVAGELDESSATEANTGIPAWANEAFQALLFKVGGLTLAVPLLELCGVLEWPETVTPMPGHADFYLGLVNHLDKSIPIVDTARLVLPAERLERLADDDPLERVNRIVLIDEGRWGLACDSVEEVVTLSPGDVRWRESRPSRPWLSGTVVEHMCALIDGAAFANRLHTGQSD